jgi:hypothetical protein
MMTVTLDFPALIALVLGLLVVAVGSRRGRGCGCGTLVSTRVGLVLIAGGITLLSRDPVFNRWLGGL